MTSLVTEFLLDPITETIHTQSHLQKIPAGLDPSETKAMEKRRKVTVKTMEAMSVLDIAAGAMEQEETESMSAAAEKRSKRSL